MARRKIETIAKFEQILIYVDGPQLILLESPTKTKIVAIAVNEKGFTNPFFASEVSRDQFAEYIAEKFDLRYLLSRANLKRYFLFDYDDMRDGLVEMQHIRPNEQRRDRYLPESGLFARDHTEEFSHKPNGAFTTEIYSIDGSWDLPEFSKFYGQVSDLYALLNSVELYADEQEELINRRRVQQAFIKPFRGGSSYVSMFDILAAAQPRGHRLHVGGIEYHSPGYVEIRGRANAFFEIRELVNRLDGNRENLDKGYRRLRKLLSENKLLKRASDKFDKKSDLARDITVEGREFAKSLGAFRWGVLMRMSGRNPLIAAKVLLSAYRRIIRLQDFFAQGRVAFSSEGIANEESARPAT